MGASGVVIDAYNEEEFILEVQLLVETSDHKRYKREMKRKLFY